MNPRRVVHSRISKLTAAIQNRRPVRLMRPFEDESIHGFVLAVGPRWFLLANLDNAVRLDGFQCFRVADVRDLQVPHPQAAFCESALRATGQRRPRRPRVDVASVEDLLLSAGRAYPLVTIHSERADPGVCRIGRVAGVRNGWLSLLEIGIDARWDAEPSMYRLRDITRIDFGGYYERALHLVGGRPPAL